MPRLQPRCVALAIALCASAACSQTSTSPTTANGSDAVAASALTSDDAADNGPAPLDCKIFAPGEVASIFTVPTKVSHDSIRNGCTFATADGGSLNINTGSYDDANFSLPWDDVTKSSDSANYLPLSGVGDQAFFQKKSGTEFFSKKGDLYCIVSMTAIDQADQASVYHIAEQSAEERGRALGALCSKAFAAH